MKFIDRGDAGMHTIELTRRNLQTLLDKLDDPASKRTLIDPDWRLAVKAVEDPEYQVEVKAVQDVEHYADRAPGEVFMPTSGEYR